MKKYKKIIILFICTILIFSITACKETDNYLEENKPIITYSNLANENSIDEIEELLIKQLDKESVASFIEGVKEYNKIAEDSGLAGDFIKSSPQYDIDKISALWSEKKGDFIGTNCRINSYILLKNNIKIPEMEIDDKLLFLDNNAIEVGNLFSSEEKKQFQALFSEVKTESTQDVKIHAENMEKHFKNIEFDENARMISVVLHDNIEGDYLFIGHVGILIPDEDKFIFIEKLSFEEPYQAVKFNTKEECYSYLQNKYAHYTGEGLAPPFIMDNYKIAEIK